MLTSKQRAYLRALANSYDTLLTVGKDSLTPAVASSLDEVLTKRELVKCRVLETSGITAREAADRLAGQTGADVVQVIGTRFVLFRRNNANPVIPMDI